MPGMRTTGVTDKLTGIGGNAIRSSRSVGTLSAHSQPCLPAPSVSRRIGTNAAGRERFAASNVHSMSTNEGRSSDTGRIRLRPILPAFVGIAIGSKFVTRPVQSHLKSLNSTKLRMQMCVCVSVFREGRDRCTQTPWQSSGRNSCGGAPRYNDANDAVPPLCLGLLGSSDNVNSCAAPPF